MTASSYVDTDRGYRWSRTGHADARSNDVIASPKRLRLLEVDHAIVAYTHSSAHCNRAAWSPHTVRAPLAAHAVSLKSP
jgi:hypothetical protein